VVASGKREEGASRRREAILNAACEEFLLKGYAATRVEDVAKRAGVAKGTIYLNFPDKQALFEAMVRSALRPQRENIEAMAEAPHASAHGFFKNVFPKAIADFTVSRGADVMRLLIAEGLRFPTVAQFYYREIIEPMMALQRRDLALAAAEGKLANPSIVQFPQLLEAPMLLATIWHGLFAPFDPLDVEAMMQTYMDCLFPNQNETSGYRPPGGPD
jgi:AcrR family transcriptional regulator